MKRLVAIGVVLALACAGAGWGGRSSSVHTKAAAREEALRLLASYVPPRGAVRLDRAPAGAGFLVRNSRWGIVGKHVTVHRYWRVPESVTSFESSLARQPRPGWRGAGITSTGASGSRLVNTEATYQRFGFGGRLPAQLLRVAAVARGHGSIVRVDVAVVWQLSARQRENIPAGVREIDIRGPHAADQIRDPSQVRTVVGWFNGLEIAQSYATLLGCPLVVQSSYTFDFRGPHGSLVAELRVPQFSSYCSEATYTLRGKEVTPLIGGDIDYRVQELIGANWFGPTDTQAVANRREFRAAHVASVLLRNFRPPPGATRTRAPKEYGGVLRSVARPFGEFVEHTRFYRVPAKPASVVAFLQAHDVPAGFVPRCGSNAHSGSAQCDLYAHPAGSRYLQFSVQRTRKGTSILRVDAQVVWVYPRSPKESVRASRVREIDFSAPKVSKRVKDPAQIAQIVRWFDAAPILPPGMGSPLCGVLITRRVTLDFRGAGGKVLAHVSADVAEPRGGTSACNPMSVRIAGTPSPQLISNDFFGRVQHAIGVTAR